MVENIIRPQINTYHILFFLLWFSLPFLFAIRVNIVMKNIWRMYYDCVQHNKLSVIQRRNLRTNLLKKRWKMFFQFWKTEWYIEEV